ncbi:MoxR family ATPase [Pseudomonas sp. F1_0610]|uniref:AAA family ATPase n=1 Tax=Pseudomonas sp. F1_0610 TaxID=3114284 RepID=UPI0039C469B0
MRQQLLACVKTINQVILGKEHQVNLAVCCLLAKGHLLLEDLPGMGKTTLSHVLAQVLGLSYQRIQFTSDLLPGDVLGTSVFDRSNNAFVFHPGPIFAQVVLADEVNRATPKSQSALLEAMEERQVSIEGKTHLLPDPFFVIATQNPSTQSGTFPLPESQLDRFLMRISLGYPPEKAEKKLLLAGGARRTLNQAAILTIEGLKKAQQEVVQIEASEVLIDYILRLVTATRSQSQFVEGLSPRASLGLLAAAKAWAYMAGRSYVIPEDVQAVLPAVVSHRLNEPVSTNLQAGGKQVQWLLNNTPTVA